MPLCARRDSGVAFVLIIVLSAGLMILSSLSIQMSLNERVVLEVQEGDLFSREIAESAAGVYVHCESGKGRAPTMAALVLLARGVVDSPEAALELVQKRRPTASPTRADVAFIRRMAQRIG